MSNIQVLNKVPVMPQDYIELKKTSDSITTLVSPSDICTFTIRGGIVGPTTHGGYFKHLDTDVTADLSAKKNFRFLILGNLGSSYRPVPVPENGDLDRLAKYEYCYRDHAAKITGVKFRTYGDSTETGELLRTNASEVEARHPIFVCNSGRSTLIIDLQKLNKGKPVTCGTTIALSGANLIELMGFYADVTWRENVWPNVTIQTQYMYDDNCVYIREIVIDYTHIDFKLEWSSRSRLLTTCQVDRYGRTVTRNYGYLKEIDFELSGALI